MDKLSFFIGDSSYPHGLFAEVTSEGKEYHYCNGELHVVYDEKGNEIWKLNNG